MKSGTLKVKKKERIPKQVHHVVILFNISIFDGTFLGNPILSPHPSSNVTEKLV